MKKQIAIVLVALVLGIGSIVAWDKFNSSPINVVTAAYQADKVEIKSGPSWCKAFSKPNVLKLFAVDMIFYKSKRMMIIFPNMRDSNIIRPKLTNNNGTITAKSTSLQFLRSLISEEDGLNLGINAAATATFDDNAVLPNEIEIEWVITSNNDSDNGICQIVTDGTLRNVPAISNFVLTKSNKSLDFKEIKNMFDEYSSLTTKTVLTSNDINNTYQPQ